MERAYRESTTVGRAAPAALALAAALALVLSASSGASAAPSDSVREGGLNLTAAVDRPSLAPRFGTRVLREGMTGPDVRVLRSLVSSKTIVPRLLKVGIGSLFDSTTRRAVIDFQAEAGLKTTGVVTRRTADEMVSSMPRVGASWYGPGLYGNGTACGHRFTASIVGVAHKTLPCGTRVLIAYRGRFLLTRVIDRGPYAHGRTWDLSNGAMLALGYQGIDPVRHAVIGR